MSCPICGVFDPGDDATGYHAPHVCPGCQAEGWIETNTGEYVNERTQTAMVLEQWLTAQTDPRR